VDSAVKFAVAAKMSELPLSEVRFAIAHFLTLILTCIIIGIKKVLRLRYDEMDI